MERNRYNPEQAPDSDTWVNLDEFIRRNADPIWLHQNEMWHLMGMNDYDGEEL